MNGLFQGKERLGNAVNARFERKQVARLGPKVERIGAHAFARRGHIKRSQVHPAKAHRGHVGGRNLYVAQANAGIGKLRNPRAAPMGHPQVALGSPPLDPSGMPSSWV